MVALEYVSSDDVPHALERVEKVRYERATFVQKCSRQMAKGPEVGEDGKQGVLNGYQFSQVLESRSNLIIVSQQLSWS